MSISAARRRIQATAQESIAPRKILFGIGFVVLVLGYLVHSEVELPKFALALGGGIGLLGLFFIGMRRLDIPLYVMVAYLPFSKMLTGDFGGIMTALNLTNLLLIVIFMSWGANTAIEGRVRLEPHALHVPILLFVGWVLVSCGYHISRLGPE